MDKTTIIVCAVVGSLGVLSAILGFSAEGTKLTPYTILVYGDDCIYPPNPAIGLGVCAAIFLLVAQVTFSAAGGCCGCCKSRSIPSETKRIVGIICAVFSWVAAVIAWALLIEGASWNANVVRETAPDCYYLKDGIFAGAGVLTLAATALGITSFIMLRRQPAAPAPAGGTPNGQGEQKPPAVVGTPPLPPQQSKPQQPWKAQVPPPPAHPQGHGSEESQNAQPSPPAAAQGDGSHSHATNQELPAHQGRPARPADAAPPAVASTGQLPLPLRVEMGPPVVPISLPQPQVSVPNDMLQYQVPVPSAAPQQQQGYGQVIGQEIAKAGVRLAARVVEQSLFSDNITAPILSGAGDPDTLVSVIADPNTVAAVIQAAAS